MGRQSLHPRRETIAPFRNGANELLPVSATFQRLAQDRDRAGEAALLYEGVLPDVFQQVLFFYYVSGVLDQEQQSVSGFRGKGNGSVSAVKDTPSWVQAESPEFIETSLHGVSHQAHTAVTSR